jgi:hypothetical protein
MGNVDAFRGRMTPALILVALVALVVVALGMVAGPANAQATFTVCSSCHDYAFNDAFHQKTTHAAQTCATCHVNGSGKAGLVPSACATCHTPVADVLARPTHAANACGTTPGCHGVPPATVTTTMTMTVKPSTTTLGKTVKFAGVAGPAASLAGAKIALKVERKVGTKWVKMKATTKTAGATGAFSWSYKTVKKGAHRVTASITATSTYTAKKLVKPFKVR